MIKIKKSQNKKTLESDMIHLITLNISTGTFYKITVKFPVELVEKSALNEL